MGLRWRSWEHVVRVVAVAAVAMAGCGGSGGPGDDGGGAAGSGAGDSGSRDADLHPPATIDLEGCSSIVLPEGSDCSLCCHAAGFMNAGFPLGNECACGPSAGKDTVVCASQLESEVVCLSCCTGASYKYGNWSAGASCECNIKFDAAVCASATATLEACTVCCLNAGSLGKDYSEEAKTCVCVA